MKPDVEKQFLTAVSEVSGRLAGLGLSGPVIEHKGHACFVEFQGRAKTVEFIFGPSDWDVEMFISDSQHRLAFRDLLELPQIDAWVKSSRLQRIGTRSIRNELAWYVDLLEFSLPLLQ